LINTNKSNNLMLLTAPLAVSRGYNKNISIRSVEDTGIARIKEENDHD